MMRLILALQTVGATGIPSDFNLKSVKPSAPDTIVVTGRRRSQRIEPDAITGEPPLGRAEIAIGNAKADLQVSSQSFGNGTTSQRVMVGIKIPF